MDKKDVSNKEIKEFLKTPKGKAVLFFGAYFLFFIFIAVYARVGGTSNINREYEAEGPLKFNIESILNNNFKFNYQVVIDNGIVTYNGDSTKEGMLFVMNGTDTYYFNSNNYFNNSSGVWVNVSNPIVYYQFMDTNNINTLLEKATYISKTEYDSGKKVYNFSISSSTINQLFENLDIDVEEIPNEIVVSVDEDNNINEVKYLLNSYCKVKGVCITGMAITLSYDNFGQVNNIISPLE